MKCAVELVEIIAWLKVSGLGMVSLALKYIKL